MNHYFRSLFKKKRKSKDDRIRDFIRDLQRVYGRHGQWLSPAEMVVMSKNRADSKWWVNRCVQITEQKSDG